MKMMGKNGKENPDDRERLNVNVVSGVVHGGKSYAPATNSLFLDSDDEGGESDYSDLAAQCDVLQQQTAKIANRDARHHESLSLQSDIFRSLHTQSQESDQAPSRLDDRSREQTQLHRLLGDYMLTAKGDRIMDQMEDAVRDLDHDLAKHTENETSSQLIAENSNDSGGDLADLLESMDEIARYIAEN